MAQMPTTNPDTPAMINRICSLLVHHGVLGVSLDDGIFHMRCCHTSVSKYFARGNQRDGVSLAVGNLDGFGSCKGGARNFCLGGSICVANLLVYTNFHTHIQTHASIHIHKKLVSFIINT